MFPGTSCFLFVSDCGSLEEPANGNMQLTGTLFGDVATFSCSIGFQLFGVDSITCGPEGQWTSAVPVCHVTGKKISYSEKS